MTEKAPSFLGAFVIERVLFSKWIYRLIVYILRLLIQKHRINMSISVDIRRNIWYNLRRR